jgi:4,5-dihydroxyphthalate decarboxylase
MILEAKKIEQDYYRRTGIFPISHAVVIRRPFIDQHPWIAGELFRIWSEAKRIALEDDEDPTYSNFAWIRDLWEEQRRTLGADPWRYGIRENETVIEALLRYAKEQGLLGGEVSVESAFCSMEGL